MTPPHCVCYSDIFSESSSHRTLYFPGCHNVASSSSKPNFITYLLMSLLGYTVFRITISLSDRKKLWKLFRKHVFNFYTTKTNLFSEAFYELRESCFLLTAEKTQPNHTDIINEKTWFSDSTIMMTDWNKSDPAFHVFGEETVCMKTHTCLKCLFRHLGPSRNPISRRGLC